MSRSSSHLGEVEREAKLLSRVIRGKEAPDPAAATLMRLARLGGRLLQHDGTAMRLRPVRHAPGQEILRWRRITLWLPPSLLIAAASRDNAPPPPRVRLLDDSLAPAGPVALLHVHGGAVPTFDVVWASLRRRLLTTPQEVQLSASPFNFGGDKESHKDFWRELLRIGFVIRESLAEWAHRRPYAVVSPPPDFTGAWRRLWVTFARGAWSAQALDHVAYVAPTRAELSHRLFRETHGRHGNIDPDRRLANAVRRDVDQERSFVSSAVHWRPPTHEEHQGPSFEGLLLQYLRLKVLLYRHLTAKPNTPGLKAFEKRYQRISAYLDRDLWALYYESAIDEPGLTVAAVEVRCTPRTWLDVHRRMPRPLPDSCTVESAWIIHVVRTDAGRVPPRTATDQGRLFRRSFYEKADSARLVCLQLEVDATQLRHLRGLDLAGVEGREPLWLNLPHLRRIRDRSVKLASRHPARGLRPLQLTLHVGEDFRHLASGLRAIHEPFAWNVLERCDRLGHALALGVDVEQWFAQRRLNGGVVVRVRAWERLLDLGWLRYCTRRFRLEVPYSQIERWTDEAERIVRRLWGNRSAEDLFGAAGAPDRAASRLSILDLLAIGWLALGSRSLLPMLVHQPSEESPRNLLRIRDRDDDADEMLLPADEIGLQWLHEYIHRPAVRNVARELIDVEIDEDPSVLCAIQRHLLELVEGWQTTIEVNPTSNFIIAGFDHPLAQPMYRLRPLDPAAKGRVPVAISSDDPITFSTCLADEYAYAWAGAVVGAGQPASYVCAWLEEAAAASMRARFTERSTGPRAARAGRRTPSD